MGEEHYYRLATRAEALLILGREEEAAAVLGQAHEVVGGDLAALATTRKQLRLVCQAAHLDAAVLAGFGPPCVIHFCGHIILPQGRQGRFAADQEDLVKATIGEGLERHSVGFGYGSLAAGADILFAEALLERQAELHVALPFRREEFVEISVRPSGEAWVERFERCLKAAHSVRFTTEDSYLNDDQLFSYCSGTAMGLAVLRARYLDGPLMQMAVWDGVPPAAPVGTAFDVVQWRDLGLQQEIIPLPAAIPASSAPAPAAAPPASEGLHRVRRAMLFDDVKGFSKLGDRDLPLFVEQILGRLAEVIDKFGDRVSFRNTWGDGVFVVFESVGEAARCALEMQATMAQLRRQGSDLPDDMALRLGGHYGPIFRTRDPVLKVENYFGAHVSRTARIEPVTPEGCVYVSESFAAQLTLEQATRFACDYVGNHPAAKGYGSLPMYLLRRLGDEIAAL